MRPDVLVFLSDLGALSIVRLSSAFFPGEGLFNRLAQISPLHGGDILEIFIGDFAGAVIADLPFELAELRSGRQE